MATELPSKTEIITFAADRFQRDLYESVRVAADDFVRRALIRQGLRRLADHHSDALPRLRQVCCDPYLLKGRHLPARMERVKLHWLLDTLPELVAEGRRVLVFSQFAQMLQIVAAELQGRARPRCC